MDGNVSLSTAALLLGAFGAVALTVAFLWYYRKTGGAQALEKALANYKSLAESEKAKREAAEREVEDLKAELEARTEERDKALADGNECAKETLRLLARIRRMESVVNHLERRCGVPETDFDDPAAIHRTDGPGH
jgi:Flp pilus assembly protein TadB